jgi:chorismate mutase
MPFLVLPGCGQADPKPPETVMLPSAMSEPTPPPVTAPLNVALEVDKLLVLMNERLALMHDIARWKWNHGHPITDPVREQHLFENLEKQGQAHGLSPDETKAFFQAQVHAGKLIQQRWVDEWKAAQQPPFENVPELATVLRPRIDELNTSLMTVLAKLQPQLATSEAQTAIRRRSAVLLIGLKIDDDVRRQAIEPLVKRMRDAG